MLSRAARVPSLPVSVATETGTQGSLTAKPRTKPATVTHLVHLKCENASQAPNAQMCNAPQVFVNLTAHE